MLKVMDMRSFCFGCEQWGCHLFLDHETTLQCRTACFGEQPAQLSVAVLDDLIL
jgi:hypothetical protein